MYEMDQEEEPRGGLRGGLKSLWSRWTDRGDEEDFVEQEPAEAPRTTFSHGTSATGTSTTPGATFRLATVRDSAITIMPAATFDDIQRAADRLKRGEPQIINLEKTDPDNAERLIDFLNGVTYALDGCVEKVAEGAYLFTPANIAIRADGAEPASARSYFDRG